MIRTVLRCVGAVAAGMAAALVLVVAMEAFGGVVHPFPEGFAGTFEEVCRHVERYPAWVLAVGVGAWGAAALAGAWVAGRVGGRGCALVVGGLLLAAALFNVASLPYPAWFRAASPVVISLAVVLGQRAAGRRGGARTELQKT